MAILTLPQPRVRRLSCWWLRTGLPWRKSCTVPWAVFVGKSPGSVGNVFQDWVANMTTAGKILIFWGGRISEWIIMTSWSEDHRKHIEGRIRSLSISGMQYLRIANNGVPVFLPWIINQFTSILHKPRESINKMFPSSPPHVFQSHHHQKVFHPTS